MRYLVVLSAVLLLCGCGAVGAPSLALTPEGAIQAFHDAGLVAELDPTNRPPLLPYATLGLLRSQTFIVFPRALGQRHALVLYDTPEHAEAARAAATTDYTNGFRRGPLVLVWSTSKGEPVGLYFTILQTMKP